MALKVKAKEREMKVGLCTGTYRYVMVPELYSQLASEKVIREAALRSGGTTTDPDDDPPANDH